MHCQFKGHKTVNFSFLLFSFLLIFFSPAIITYSQIKPLIYFTEDEGLANNTVFDIAKDRNNILWVATHNGLSKYDGCEFRNFYKSDGLPNNYVWAVTTDNNNTVYAACYLGGLAVIKKDSVINTFFTPDKHRNSFRKLYYSSYYDIVLAGTDYGLYILKDSVLTHLDFRTKKTENAKYSVLSFASNGPDIFFTAHGDNQGLYKLNIDTVNNEYSAEYLSPHGIFASTIINDTIYYSKNSNLYSLPISLNDNEKLLTRFDKKSIIWSMTPYNNNELLLGCYNDGRYQQNLIKYNFHNNETSYNFNRLKARSVLNIMNDTENKNIWYCSDAGLACMLNSPFEYYEPDIKNEILDICYYNDTLFVLTKSEILYFENGRLHPVASANYINKHISIQLKKLQAISGENIKDYGISKPPSQLAYFLKDNNKLFIYTARGAISFPDMKTYYPLNLGTFKKIDDHSLYSQFPYRNVRYYPSDKSFLTYKELKGKHGYIKDVFRIIESNGIYYFASYFNGLYAVKDSNVFYLNSKLNPDFDDHLTDILKDGKGNIWCTSTNGNLFLVNFDDSLSIVKKLNEKNAAIYGNNYKWIKIVNDHMLVSSNKGLNRIPCNNLYSDSVKADLFFNKYNGYNFISAKHPVIDKEDNVYVFTKDKIIRILPEYSKGDIGNIMFEDIHISNKPTELKDIENQSISFASHRISFTFKVIKYPTAKNIIYRYRINHGKWATGNHVNLESLRGGDYTIETEAIDKETNSSTERTLSFSINKPFWQTWWFVFIIIMSMTFFIYLIFRIREQRLKRFHEEKTRLVIHNSELKLRSLQLQMNPHFVFNSLTSIQGLIMNDSSDEALVYLGDLASIIRASLENATEDYIPLTEEIEFLKTFAEIEKYRFKNKFEINFINYLKTENAGIPPMLLQPIIENAIKHGIAGLDRKGIINITFELNDRILTVTIEDNGLGRNNGNSNGHKEHTGKAISIINERLALLNDKHNTNVHKMKIIDLFKEGKPAGTKVVITLLLTEILKNKE